MTVCGYIKGNGERCRAQPMKGESYCYVHHPDMKDKRQAASSRGGKTGGRGRPTKDLKDVKAWLLKLASDVESGELDTRAGAVVAQILNVYLRGVEVERKIKESEELEERLKALEGVLKNRDRRAG